MDLDTDNDPALLSLRLEIEARLLHASAFLLFIAVLLALSLHLYRRCGIHRRRSLFHHRFILSGENLESDRILHRLGLDAAVLASLPILVFRAEGAAAECAVCLSEFEDGDKFRSLHRCGHRFHVDCIDMWFHSHTTCPICRSPVEAGPPPPPQVANAADPRPPCSEEEGIGSSTVNAGRGERIWIEVPRGGAEEEIGLRPQSPLRIPRTDLLHQGRQSALGTELENGEASKGALPPPLPSPPLRLRTEDK
ncbi:RING-H2 finger protein ATL64-like [Canna indica]|uniref:RING-H2 finger protein ATL64-like n=1 Tax=Canna indica TaxID=4628 RepID=A0AAQ3KJI5_9LILI|nr:RING-H2 finger protein ATL64-like [Canna indica]